MKNISLKTENLKEVLSAQDDESDDFWVILMKPRGEG